MAIDVTNEKRFESDIEAAFLSPAGGYTKGADVYDPKAGLFVDTFIGFIKETQPTSWARFENANRIDTVRKSGGAFTDGDRVMLAALRSKLMENEKLKTSARTSDPQIFSESIFSKVFGAAANESYMESQETYTSLFADKAKYNAVMSVLGAVLYRDMRTHPTL